MGDIIGKQKSWNYLVVLTFFRIFALKLKENKFNN